MRYDEASFDVGDVVVTTRSSFIIKKGGKQTLWVNAGAIFVILGRKEAPIGNGFIEDVIVYTFLYDDTVCTRVLPKQSSVWFRTICSINEGSDVDEPTTW